MSISLYIHIALASIKISHISKAPMKSPLDAISINKLLSSFITSFYHIVPNNQDEDERKQKERKKPKIETSY